MVRFKNRYVLYQISWEDPLQSTFRTSKHVYDVVRAQVVRQYGQFPWGLLKRHTHVKYYNAETGLCIIRMPRDQSDVITSSVASIGTVAKRRVMFRQLWMSATVKQVHKAALRHHRRCMLAHVRIQKLEAVRDKTDASEQKLQSGTSEVAVKKEDSETIEAFGDFVSLEDLESDDE
ncbi:MAG: hypothetical protein MHM6MM_002549 [Cercozoa sp. M6MM]